MKWLQHLLDIRMQGMICCNISFCSSSSSYKSLQMYLFYVVVLFCSLQGLCFCTAFDKLATVVHVLASMHFHCSGNLFTGLLCFRTCLGCCGTAVLCCELAYKNTHRQTQTHTLKIYTRTCLPCIFTSVAYIILETSQGCCIEKSTENSERDIFHFFITTHVVLLQVEDLLHSLTPSALLKKI